MMSGVLLGLTALQGVTLAGASAHPPPIIWFDKPTTEYMSGLPLGTGTIGAMVVGEPSSERIALNHHWLWRGKTRNRKNPTVAQNLPGIRKLFFEGKIIEASNRANAELGTLPETGVDSYQPVGDLILHFPTNGQETDYRRELNLSTGIARTSYRLNGAVYTREVFTSRANGLLVVHLACDQPQLLSGDIEISRITDPECTIRPWIQGSWMGFAGRFHEGIDFAAEVRVLADGGSITQGDIRAGLSGEMIRCKTPMASRYSSA